MRKDYIFKVEAIAVLGLLVFLASCAGPSRPGSEIPTATTSEALPQRSSTPAPSSSQPGLTASRSEPIIYDYPGPTRDLRSAPNPTPASNSGATPAPTPPPQVTSSPATGVHTVQAGDTLWGISKKYGISVDVLRQINSLTTDTIKPGQTLKLP
ncbi:MAG: LysM peptidoglycan-binding domain-containing protein [Blastochloris sp.]|nr:LysM peptidoglycan-binding domain-containing protein [Blastochloris sp.]